jgi:hypothetical protein
MLKFMHNFFNIPRPAIIICAIVIILSALVRHELPPNHNVETRPQILGNNFSQQEINLLHHTNDLQIREIQLLEEQKILLQGIIKEQHPSVPTPALTP